VKNGTIHALFVLMLFSVLAFWFKKQTFDKISEGQEAAFSDRDPQRAVFAFLIMPENVRAMVPMLFFLP
jgi:hypothetical protein